MKVVINTRYGGFGLSRKALEMYSVLKYGENFVKDHRSYHYVKIDENVFYENDNDRDDPLLVKVVEELGEDSFGKYSRLVVREIPDGSEWEIEEYDGRESLRKPCTYY